MQNDMKQLFLNKFANVDGALEKYIASANVFDEVTVPCYDCDFRLKCLGYDVASYWAFEKIYCKC